MNGKRLHREFAISKGIDCKSFVKVESDWYGEYILHYKDSKGACGKFRFMYNEMVYWLIKNGNNKVFNHLKLGEV